YEFQMQYGLMGGLLVLHLGLAGVLAHVRYILVIAWATVVIWVVEALDPTIQMFHEVAAVDCVLQRSCIVLSCGLSKQF
ncbi:hypothetical protein Tco_1158230, partial [Tanacetum coccineum]